ncbi:MAG: tyrosine-type recombinase/integrase [Lachnospiraceae bacterium]|nr:tyrosine-type recombinase/integrase [Lachnospiraceae bacterium]
MKNLSPKTIYAYECFVLPFVQFVGASSDVMVIDTDIVLNYIVTLFERPLADATRATYIRHIKAFIRWLKDYYAIPVALSEIEIPKTEKKFVRILSNEDVKHLFSCIQSKPAWIQARDRAIIALMLDSGLRQNEVSTLLRSNVYASYAIVQGKGSKERAVPIGSMVRRFLDAYYSLCPFQSEYVFADRHGSQLSNNAIKLMVQKVKRASGIDFSSHKLRHNFATNYCIDSLETTGQCDAYTLKALMGHESISTTERYMHYAQSLIASKNNHSHLDSVFGV